MKESLTTCLLFFLASMSLATEYLKMTVSGSGIETNFSDVITLTSEQSATYMLKEGNDSDSSVQFLRCGSGSLHEVALLEGSKVVGPASVCLRYSGVAISSSANVTSVVMIASAGKLTTDDGIAVVPNESGEPVTVVIETSTDLENWVVAQPGDYGMTDKKRFFRVKATRKEE